MQTNSIEFIGHENRNKCLVSVTDDGNDVYFFGHRLHVPPAFREAAQRYKGRDVMLGIRPEHLDISPTPEHGGWTLRVDTVELLGAERLVHARLGDETLTLRLDESLPAPPAGSTFCATPRADRVHWFDAATQKRIT